MKLKAVLILVLLGAVLYTLTSGTLSGFTDEFSLRATVVPDMSAFHSRAAPEQKTQSSQIIENTDTQTAQEDQVPTSETAENTQIQIGQEQDNLNTVILEENIP